jgi:glutathione S-transferase
MPEIKSSLKWEVERAVTHFETLLGEGLFLMGDTMTIADILAAHCGGWAIAARFPVESELFHAYVDRLRARPAFARAAARG